MTSKVYLTKNQILFKYFAELVFFQLQLQTFHVGVHLSPFDWVMKKEKGSLFMERCVPM